MSQYSSINFLRERVRVQEAVLVTDRKIALGTSIGLGIFIAILISLTGYRAFLGRQLQKLEDATTVEQQNLQSLSSIQSQIIDRSARLSIIRSIFEKRGKKWDAITYFYRELPTASTISSVNLSGTDGTLNFTVSTPNVFAFEELSKKLQSPEVKESGYQVQMGSLTRARTGIYELTVKLDLEGTANPKPSNGQSLGGAQ